MHFMKRIVLLAAAIGSCFVVASPAMAQPTLQFGIGADGRPNIDVRDPAQERYERRESWRQRREAERAAAYEQGRRDAWRRRQAYRVNDSRCRNITIREENEWGRTVTRRIRRCD
jgi:hypothetical protein